MTVWIGLFIWIVIAKALVGVLSTDKRKRTFLILVGIALVLIMGCRYADIDSRGDLNNYARLYTKIKDVEWKSVIGYNNMEPGYLIMNKFLSTVLPWTQSIIFIEAFICVFSTFRFIYKNCRDVYLAVLLYLAQGPFIFQLTGFRQAIAMSICLFAVEYVKKRKLFRFLILVGLACTFHTTAVMFIPFYFVANFKLSFKTIAIYTVYYILMLFSAPMLLLWGSNLTGSDYTEAGFLGNLTGSLINLFFYAVTLFLALYISKHGGETIRWKWNMSFLGVVIYLMRFISLPFERISFYFSSGIEVYLPELVIDAFDEKGKKAAYYGFVCICILLFLVRAKNTIGPYKFFI
ncbi:MAG: EpsG family protein [Clostridia bacterium]|nr:EpsG family protein [Clostridia bacterium]